MRDSEISELVDNVCAEWSDDLPLGEWWRLLSEARLTFPHWPEPWGRGWDTAQVSVWRDRMQHHGVLGPPTGLGVLMGGPIVLDHANAEQQDRFLPALANGTSAWCQLFSEPGAGSDLAGLTTTAERDGDDWIVTGQKVWTSGAMHADHGMLIARTNWDAPKHRGIGYFVFPMDQPGVEVRPLKQMNGAAHFNEVFLNEARVSHDNLIGPAGEGWRVARATLGYERRGLGAAGIRGPRPTAGRGGGQLDRPVGEIMASHRSRAREGNIAAVGSAARLRTLVDGELGAVQRDRLAALTIQERVEAGVAGQQPLAVKLAWTERLRAASDMATQLLGPAAMLDGDDGPGSITNFMLSIPSASIAGGTDEVQRNILGERALGLPREPEVERDTPFREVPRNA
ncbi:MAG: acyl-CoA dehydrogenase family protein [Actinomycetota bacterium]